VDKLPQCAVILAVGERGIEARQAPAAKTASPVLIQGIGIQERRLAVNAEKVGNQRRRGRKASGTDRNPGNFMEGRTADAAIVREDEVEQRRRNPTGGEVVDTRQNCE
jgi:hypothetical protein